MATECITAHDTARLPVIDIFGHGYNADLQTDQQVNYRLNLRTRFAVYPLVGPQAAL